MDQDNRKVCILRWACEVLGDQNVYNIDMLKKQFIILSHESEHAAKITPHSLIFKGHATFQLVRAYLSFLNNPSYISPKRSNIKSTKFWQISKAKSRRNNKLNQESLLLLVQDFPNKITFQALLLEVDQLTKSRELQGDFHIQWETREYFRLKNLQFNFLTKSQNFQHIKKSISMKLHNF